MDAKREKRKSPKTHLVMGKIYSNGCIHCVMMSTPWEEMCSQLKKDMNLVEDAEKDNHFTEYKKYVSPGGKKIVEIIEIEAEHMDDELPHLQKKYSPKIELQGGFPTIFKMKNNEVSFYGGERTAEKMKQWYMSDKVAGGRRTRRKRNNKTKKNKTRTRYVR